MSRSYRCCTGLLRVGLAVLLPGLATAAPPRVTFEALPALRDLSIRVSSADGWVVAGSGRNGCCLSQAFRWDGSGPPVWLALPSGQLETYVRDISADGRSVLVQARGGTATGTGYLWQQDGSVLRVTPEADPHVVIAISAQGEQVAGSTFRRDDSRQERPFIWSAQTGYRALEIPAGAEGAYPAYFDADGHTLHGVGYVVDPALSDEYSRVTYPVAVHWHKGEPQALTSLGRLTDSYLVDGSRLLSQPQADALNVHLPYPQLPDGEPIRVNWVSADGDLILGEAALSRTRVIWTRANGTCRLNDWLNALGVAYPRDARLYANFSSRDGRMLFGESDRPAQEEPFTTPWRVVADTPLGRMRVTATPYCGGAMP